MSIDGTTFSFVPYTLNGISPVASSTDISNCVKYTGNTSNTNLNGYDLETTGTLAAQYLALPADNTKTENFVMYSISTNGNLSSIGGLITTDLTSGRSMYFTGGVVGAPGFQFTTLGSGGKIIVTNGDGVMSTTISAGQLNYITALTSQAAGIGQTNTWTSLQTHNATIEMTGSNKLIQPYNALTADISTVVNRATLDSAISGLGAGILNLNNVWTGTNTFQNNLSTTVGYVTNINTVLKTNINDLGYGIADFSTAGIVGTYAAPLGTITNPSAGVYQIAQTASGRSVMRIPAFGTGNVFTTYVFSFVIKCTVGTATISVEQNGALISPALYQLSTGYTTITGSFKVNGTSNSPVFLIYTGVASWNALWTSFTLGSYSVNVSDAPLNINSVSASRALITDASKNVSASATTSTELGYLSGTTSAVQTQLNDKASLTANNIHVTGTNTFAQSVYISGLGSGLSVAYGNIVKQSATALSFMQITGGNSTNSPYMEFFFGGNSRGYIGNATATDLDLVAQNGASLNFWTAGVKRLNIATNGDIQKLGTTSGYYSTWVGGSATNSPYLEFFSGGLRRLFVGYCNTSDSFVMAENGTNLLMGTNGTTRMYINTQGDVIMNGRECIVNQINGYGQFRAIGGSYGFFLRNDGSDSYFLITNPGDQYGAWSVLRPLRINNASGLVYMQNGLNMSSSDMTVYRILSNNGNRRMIMNDSDGTNYIVNNSGTTPISFGPGTWNSGGYTVFCRDTLPGGNTHALGIGGGIHSGNLARGVVIALTPGIQWGELILSAGTIYTSCFGAINNYTNGGGWVFVSDKRCKKDIKPIKTHRSLERIMALKPMTYKKIYKGGDTPIPQEVQDADHIGFLAQDVLETNPHCVSEWVDDNAVCDGDNGKRLGIAYGDIHIHAVGAIQELKKQNDAQQKEMDELRATVKRQSELLDALMAKIK